MTDTENTPAEYTVNFTTSADITITVTAANVDDAIEKAHDQGPSDVCAQCSGWGQKWSRHLGDELEMVEVSVDGEVVETGRTFVDEQISAARKATAKAAKLQEQLAAAQARIAELEASGGNVTNNAGDIAVGASFIQAGHVTGNIHF
ncbi:hypothetical protein ACWFMI_24915 [Nocardiopsis terrae]|uniref:hypothetical protein n=1 Tax=Streptomyces sp. NPDC057554 TaxID=3350538 RepID=UPI0036B9F469